jgi:hypothetical protein
MGILTSIFGRAFGSEPLSGHIDREDDFVDITLPIAEQKWAKDGSLTVIARGSINGQTVSLGVEFGPDWKPQQVKDSPITVYWGNGHIRTIGRESDAFLSLLAHEYKLPAPKIMASRVPVTMAGMDNDPSRLRTAPAKIKIFFEYGGKDHYGEAFINIDLASKTLEFRDKDPEYHKGIVLSLAGGT